MKMVNIFSVYVKLMINIVAEWFSNFLFQLALGLRKQ